MYTYSTACLYKYLHSQLQHSVSVFSRCGQDDLRIQTEPLSDFECAIVISDSQKLMI